MLPSLNRLTLVPTGGNLGNAQWPEDEVCSICTYPLARPSEDERYAWPFPGEGGGFTAVACVRGHAFHKGCLRFMQRFQDKKCPDCRTPMFKEVLTDVSRPTQEELDERRRRQAQQAEQRAREREQREREEREDEARWAQEDAYVVTHEARWAQEDAYVVTPDIDDHAVQWTFFIKGHVPTDQATWNATRAFFARHMRAEWPWTTNPIENWGQRLGIQVLHGNATPRDMPAQTDALAFTRCRFRLHLPEAVAERFADWLTGTIGHWGYVTAMDRVLGIRPAQQAGQSVAVMTGINDEDTDATVATMNSQENAGLNMTWQEYQEWAWAAWAEQNAREREEREREEREAARAPPRQQANWMLEEAMAEMRADDPIANFRPVGGAATDVTIRWRFWLKGPMTGVERSNTPMHWRRAFADAMREPGLGLPEMRTSVDPWFERLWVWTRAEEPRITGPRSGQPLNQGVVQRCEFALKLPADVARAWLMLVAQGFGGVSHWHNLVPIWFYVAYTWSTESRDRPQLDSSTLHPLVGAPMLTEAQFNAWVNWRSVPRFRSRDANGQ